jgi:hypothetical protein
LSSDRVITANDDKVIQFFGPEQMPSNSTAYIAYQITIVEIDEDDPDEVDEYISEIESEFGDDYVQEGKVDENDSDVSEKVKKFSIDYLDDDELYPIQANEVYQSDGLVKLLNVVTSDTEIAIVEDPGRIKGSYSYGVATITSTQKGGDVEISASIKGIGSDSFKTKVVNSLAQKKILLFSPTGSDALLFERDGSFDLFLVALDGANRPKILDDDLKYLVTPTNSLIELVKGTTYSLATLQGDSFSLESGDNVALNVSPIGERASSASSSQNFESQLSSKLSILLPTDNVNIENIDPENKHGVGTIQIVDLQGNPIPATKNIKVKITSSNKDIALVDNDVVINQGESFTEFPIEIPGNAGSSIISVSAKGVVGDESQITASSTASSLSIFTSGLIEPIPVNQEIQVKVFVDDDFADSIAGARIMITPNENATTSVDVIRTGPDGSATFGLTALTGPEVSVDFTVQAEGYIDGDDSIDIIVDHDPADGAIANLNLPQELVYVIIGGIIIVIIVVVLFLKKSKEPMEDEEEPWEDDDI